jgi:enamine deaminase RidA (YjgF/YER057c/UK114 family)
MRATLLLLPFLLSSCVLAIDGSDGDGKRHDRTTEHRVRTERRILNAEGRSDTTPFSHGVLVGDTLHVAGSLGLDPDTGQAPDDVETEVRLMLDSVKAKLALADMTMDDLVSVQVFCSDISLYDRFNAVYRTYFTKGFPSRAFIGSGTLLRGCRFEMNGVAVRR